MLVGGAIGSVKDSLLVFRDADERERVDRVPNVSLALEFGGMELLQGCKVKSVCLSAWEGELSVRPTCRDGGGIGLEGISSGKEMRFSSISEPEEARMASREGESCFGEPTARRNCNEAMAAGTQGLGYLLSS